MTQEREVYVQLKRLPVGRWLVISGRINVAAMVPIVVTAPISLRRIRPGPPSRVRSPLYFGLYVRFS